jgi:hypothetical protein
MAEKGWNVLGLMAVDGGRVTKDVGAEVALVSALVLELKERTASLARFAVTESGSVRFCACPQGSERSMAKIAALHGKVGDFICMPACLCREMCEREGLLDLSIGVKF